MPRVPFNPRADNAGREPLAGDYVAFNYSGQIAAGFIRLVSKDRRRFTIARILPTEGQSVVRGGPKCLLVLDRPSDT